MFTLTMPNAVAAYYRFGDLCLYNTNSFALFPKSVGRDLAMIFMSLHEMVAFGLFAGPLFHMWEKLIHIHHKPFAFRAAMRIPLCALMVFLAVAFPFFGAINAMLGAFTTSFGTYIIPAFAFNIAFKSDEGMIKQPYFNFKVEVMRIINWITVALVIILGVGYTEGTQASKTSLISLVSMRSLLSVTNVTSTASFRRLISLMSCPRKADSFDWIFRGSGLWGIIMFCSVVEFSIRAF